MLVTLYVDAKEAYETSLRSKMMGERRKRGSREAAPSSLITSTDCHDTRSNFFKMEKMKRALTRQMPARTAQI